MKCDRLDESKVVADLKIMTYILLLNGANNVNFNVFKTKLISVNCLIQPILSFINKAAANLQDCG